MTTLYKPIGAVVSTMVLECPVCSAPVTSHRIIGLRSCVGARWIVFNSHSAPCGLQCAAGGIGKKTYVHTGPSTCKCCSSGRHDVMAGEAVMIDETGYLEAEASRSEHGDKRGPNNFEGDSHE